MKNTLKKEKLVKILEILEGEPLSGLRNLRDDMSCLLVKLQETVVFDSKKYKEVHGKEVVTSLRDGLV